MESKKVYISGQITGLPIADAQIKFKEAQQLLAVAGHEPVNPMYHIPYNPIWTWEQYMLADIELLFGCTAILMLDNWQNSRGAKIEHAIALNMGIEIYYPNMHSLIM